MRRVVRLLSVILAAAVAASLLVMGPAQATAPAKRDRTTKSIKQQSFGIHSYQSRPEVPAGSLRLACAPTWAQIQPKPNEWHWEKLDALVERAVEWGYKDILFTICGAPPWAASGAFGSVDDLSDWTRFLKVLVARYKGRIDAYEVWNEVTSKAFYQGTPRRMGQMTEAAYRAIKSVDRRVTVVSASVQTHQPGWMRVFVPGYLKYLKKKGWPIDALGLHTYTLHNPWGRHKDIVRALKTFEPYKIPRRVKLWDTEVNTEVKPSAKKGAALVARAYLDSWRLGIKRTYWFMWTQKYYGFLGIQMRQGDLSTKAYVNLNSWTRKAKFRGCSDRRKLNTCQFRKKGKTFTVAYSSRGKSTYRFKGKKRVCAVTGGDCKKKRGKVRVGVVPVRIR